MPIFISQIPPTIPPARLAPNAVVFAITPICVREKPMSRKNEVDSVVAIVSPSLYRKMKPSTNSAPRQPSRWMNSLNGCTIASRRFFGGVPCTSGSRTTSVMIMPGSMNAAVTMKTVVHGRWSDRISASEPGTSAAIL